MFTEMLWKIAAVVLLFSPALFGLPDPSHHSSVEFSIVEEQNADTFIGQLNSLSLNTSPPYRIYFANNGSQRDLDVTTNGMITTKARLDREIRDVYEFVAESVLQSTHIHVTVRVSDINDNRPVFDGNSVNISLSEAFPVDAAFYVGHATDLDLGKNGVQRYDIAKGDEEVFFLHQFSDSKELLAFELKLMHQLDYEKTSSYVLVIRAFDGGTPPLYDDLVVNIIIDDVNDNLPLFTNPHYSASLLENVPKGTGVIQVEATDRDSGMNGKVEFFMESLDNANTDFVIDRTSGLVVVNAALNFSLQSTYYLMVTAKDKGFPSLQTVTVLDIEVLKANYNPLALLFRFLTDDGSSRLGKWRKVHDLVAELSLMKVDRLAGGNSDVEVTLHDDRGYFALEKNSDDKYFLALAKLPRLNHSCFHRISLTASSATAHVIKNITIQIDADNAFVNKNVSFTRTIYFTELMQTAPPGTSVLGVETTTDRKVTFKIVSGNSMGLFRIDSDTGLIETNGVFGCNATKGHVLKIFALDAEGSSASTEVVVNITGVQGHSPKFNQHFYQVFMDNNLPVGTCIKILSATDPDCHSDTIRYSLKALSNWLPFLAVNNVTGELCMARAVSDMTPMIQHFTAEAVDADGLVATAVVQLLVVPTNHPPVFTAVSYTVTVSPGVCPSGGIAAVLAVDQDPGHFGRITYKIVNDTNDKKFHIDPETGTVTAVSNYFNAGEIYHVTVVAFDGGNLTSSVPAIISIKVADESTLPGSFSRSYFAYTVPEDTPVGHLLGNVASTSRSANVKYSLLGNQFSKLFEIDEESGDVFTADVLDRETAESMLLSVQAIGAGFQSTAQIRISLSDVNDNGPEFYIKQLQIVLKEDLVPGSLVYTAHARDSDLLENGSVQYRLEEGNDFFSINRQLGEIKLKRGLNFEIQDLHAITIVASDSGNPSQSSTLNLSVVVTDVNKNSPSFVTANPTLSVEELLPIGSVVGAVTAADPDSGNNGKLFYYLNSFTDEFFIDRKSGFIFTKTVLDHEQRNKYVLRVTAIDNGVPAKSAIALVHVDVLDINEYDPEFVEDSFTFFVDDNHRHPLTLGFLSAVDLDGSSNLTYAIIPPNANFLISPSTGKLTAVKTLDREKTRIHSFVVHVVDSGSTVRSATTDVTIIVLDVNDNSPKFIPKATEPVYLDSNAPVGTFVAKVFAVDPDYGENQTISYHLHAEHSGRHLAPFAIDNNSGIVTTRLPVSQMKSEHNLRITAQDGGEQPRNTTLVLKVFVSNRLTTDPVEDALSFVVEENSPVGTVVGHLLSSETDRKNKTADYFILRGNQFGTFRVNSSTSELFVDRPVDFETVQFFHLVIKVAGRLDGSQTRLLHVNVCVVDLNDNRPQFTQGRMIHAIKENVPVGTALFQVNAVDKDSGNNGTVAYSIMSDAAAESNFVIDEVSGLLRTRIEIDYEKVARLKIVVVATDNATDPQLRLNSTMEILVLILDVNDNAPVFDMSVENVSVSEDAPIGYPAVTISASDADSHENGRVTYTLVSGNEDNRFQLNHDTGVLSVLNALDRETTEVYLLTVRAQDHGRPKHEVVSQLTVHVIDVNDNAPVFSQMLYNISLLEELPAGTQVVVLEASDHDEPLTSNANLFFYFPDDGNKIPFGIDNTSGIVFLTSPLDRESMERWIIAVRVSNVDRNGPYDSATIVVNVLDVNDNRPVFHEPFYSLEVSENSKLAVIHTVEASDRDSKNNGKITYSILDDMDGKFSIDRNSGKLSCLALDRELQPYYNLTILAADGGEPVALTSSTQILIRVLDDNDNDPIFHRASYAASVPEDIAEGTSIILLEASDLDEGLNAEVSFSLSNSTNGLFLVDSTTGVITAAGEFDREKKAFYSFEAFATDSGLYGPRSRAVRVDVTILDVNDNAPVFDKFPYRADIPLEFPVGHTVLTISATDKDAGRNGQVFYSLINHSQYFRVDPESGEIITKRLLESSAVRIHTLHVKAQDDGDRPRNSTGLVSIQVGDAKTTGILRFANQTYSIYLPENTPPATTILSVQARFANALPGTSIMYSFANGNEDGTFRIHPDTGLISVVDSAKLDYEANQRLRLIAIATAGPAYDYTTIWINLKDVNDNTPKFSQQRYTSSVWEGLVPGSYVTQVMATDIDSLANGRITYNITSGNINNVFVIDPPSTGIVKTNAVLDREVRDLYKLEIEAADCGKPSLASTATLRISVVDVNDNAPVFSALTPINIREGTEVGTMISQVSASDADVNPSLVYGFAGNGNVEDAFSIDQNSGKIFVAKKLDHETRSIYRLTLMVSDGVRNSTADLNVFIIDDNDNAPVFDRTIYEVSVLELTAPGVYVMTVEGKDADSGDNGRIEYSMLSVDGFYINSTTGAIYTSKVVVFNKLQQHIEFVVTAKDNGVPPLSANVVVRLKVIDVNNHAPIFSSSSYNIAIKEDLIVDTIILQVFASDDDHLFENSELHYSIVGGNLDDLFLMNDTTGCIKLVKALDHENRANYTLKVSVKDSGTPSLNSTSVVHVTVLDVNDNSPVFDRALYEVEVKEDATVESSILTVLATDRDSGDNSRIQYSITPWNNGTFGIDRETGVVFIRTKLNFEARTNYTLAITATDCSVDSPRRSAVAEVRIQVLDVNEYRPLFIDRLLYMESIVENQPNGTYVFTAKATDMDAGDYGVVKYRLLAESLKDDGMLRIDSNTGDVVTGGVLVYSLVNGNHNVRKFKVVAEDLGGMNNSVDLFFSIQPDAMKPHFINQSYYFVVRGSAESGDVIGQVQALDSDKKPSIHIIYFLQFENDFVAINRTNGEIFLLRSLQKVKINGAGNKGSRDPNVLFRSKREQEVESLQVIVIAQCGFPDTKKSTVAVDIIVDRSCELCALVVVTEAAALTGTHLILLIVFLIIAIIMITVVGGILLRNQRAKNCREENSHSDSSSFETIDVPPPPMGSFLPPPYLEVQTFLLHNTTSEVTNRSQSASSGRGSVNKGEDVDEEIQLINSEAMSRGIEPDSGLLIDEAGLLEPFLVAGNLESAKGNQKSGILGIGVSSSSVESMHHFSDEGGGEGDVLDIGELVNDEIGEKEFTNEMPSGHHYLSYCGPNNEHRTKLAASHSGASSCYEDLGNFDWDRFVSWKPDYFACKDVYKEIALLKDKKFLPKIKPTQFVLQPSGTGLKQFGGRTRLFPPPIITAAPPRTIPPAQSNGRQSNTSMMTNSNTASSGQTSQLNSVSLPKSALSYESTFTESPNFSSPRTLSVSPVGTCSPTVSAWNAVNGLDASDNLLTKDCSMRDYNGIEHSLSVRLRSGLET